MKLREGALEDVTMTVKETLVTSTSMTLGRPGEDGKHAVLRQRKMSRELPLIDYLEHV